MTTTLRDYETTIEPRWADYERVLRYLLGRCDRLLYVVQECHQVCHERTRFLNLLSPFLLEVRRAHSWPGTDLLSGDGEDVHIVRYTPESLELIHQFTKGPFDWAYPYLPEDPCLLRSDTSGEVAAMVTTTHERIFTLTLTDAEAIELDGQLHHCGLVTLSEEEREDSESIG